MFEVDFSRIKGQEQAVKLLKKIVLSGSYAPLYLFVGPEGVGKATAALEFAKAANCRSDKVRPCGKCPQCKKIGRFVHPDVFFLFPTRGESNGEVEREEGQVRPVNIDPGREISIKKVRELQYQLSKPPMEARQRFVIITNGENLSLEAQNSFLKTLEEPPTNTTFIMVSSNPGLILPTIRSRARKIRFYPLKLDAFSQFFDMDKSTLRVIWGLSEGSVGIARELISRNLLELRSSILEVIETKNMDMLLELRDIFTRDRSTASSFLLLFGAILRDIMLAKEGERPLLINVDMVEHIEKAAMNTSWKSIEDGFTAMRKVQEGIKRNVSLQSMFFALFRPFYRGYEAVVV